MMTENYHLTNDSSAAAPAPVPPRTLPSALRNASVASTGTDFGNSAPAYGSGGTGGTPVVLRDSGYAIIRPLQATDRPAVKALFERLSPRSLAQRFHSPGPRLTDRVLDLVTAGHALVAELEGVIVALASYCPRPGGLQAEVAIVVDDAHQSRGIGLALGTRLSHDAYRAGIQQLLAQVEGSNRVVFRLIRRLNYPIMTTWDHGAMQVEIALEPERAHAHLTGPSPLDAESPVTPHSQKRDALGEAHRVLERKTA